MRARDTYHAGLTRTAVVTAAVELLQQRGLGSFSVRRLASELDVDTMALYKHVRNKDDLLGAAVAHVFASARPVGDGEWWEQVRDIYREQRRVFRAHPWARMAMLVSPPDSSEPWEGVDLMLRLMHRHLGAAGSARWVRLLAAFTNGFVLAENDMTDTADTRQVEAHYPRVATAYERNARTGQRDFDYGLDLLITAMRADAAARPALRSAK